MALAASLAIVMSITPEADTSRVRPLIQIYASGTSYGCANPAPRVRATGAALGPTVRQRGKYVRVASRERGHALLNHLAPSTSSLRNPCDVARVLQHSLQFFDFHRLLDIEM